jgi:hypothetical protein
VTATSNYCTVWFRDTYTGQERYLPYQSANTQGQAGWTWSGAILQTGDWQVRAVQGERQSAPYTLSSK